MKRRLIFLFISISALCLSAMSQTVSVSATIDSSDIRIGEQRHIRIEVIQPQNTMVSFPLVSETDTLVPGVEILAVSKYDTIVESGTRLKISQDILVTSFDTGHYVIPPFLFETKIKKLETEKLYLNVSTIEADFAHAKVTDIADNYDPGTNWIRILLYLSIILILACIGFIAYVVYQYIQRKKLEESNEVVFVDKRLPHEIAIEELNTIKEEKVWKQGFTKQYYTSITNTLREYFVKRFNIPAMEMTSAEIVQALKYSSDAEPIINDMRQIFATSDMVKFAKHEPTQEENEISIQNAYDIVNQTVLTPKEESKAAEEGKEEDATDNLRGKETTPENTKAE